jgi:hypothetical protein
MAKQMRGAEDPTPAEELSENLAAQEAEADADETALPETAEDQQEPKYVTFEYVGEQPYGREFLASHTIYKSSAVKGHKTEHLSFGGQGIEVPEDLVWSKENDWKVKVDASLTDLVEGLKRQPFLKVRD